MVGGGDLPPHEQDPRRGRGPSPARDAQAPRTHAPGGLNVAAEPGGERPRGAHQPRDLRLPRGRRSRRVARPRRVGGPSTPRSPPNSTTYFDDLERDSTLTPPRRLPTAPSLIRPRATPLAVDAPAVGDVLGDYVLLEKLGEGGQGLSGRPGRRHSRDRRGLEDAPRPRLERRRLGRPAPPTTPARSPG